MIGADNVSHPFAFFAALCFPFCELPRQATRILSGSGDSQRLFQQISRSSDMQTKNTLWQSLQFDNGDTKGLDIPAHGNCSTGIVLGKDVQ